MASGPIRGFSTSSPPEDPKVLWRKPISSGYPGPAVADGRVYVADRELAKGAMNPTDPFDNKTVVKSTERVLCFDAKTGQELWKHEYECPYHISYPSGPRCTPTVNDGKVYALGAMGDLFCLDARTGKPIWSKNFPKDYAATIPTWGFCSHPLVYQDLVICIVGGHGSVAVAFDKNTGKEKWKNLSAREPGYSPPVIITSGGKDQVVIWHAQAINGLEPLTGKVLWSIGLEPLYGMSIMSPRQHGDKLFAAGIGGAGAVLKLEGDKVTTIWQETTAKEKGFAAKPRGVYPVNCRPLHRRRRHLRRRSARYVSRRRTQHRQETLVLLQAGDRQGRAGGLQERGFGYGLHREEWRSLFPLRGDRASHHREALAQRLRGDQPDQDPGANQRGLWPQGRLEPSSLRQQVRLRPQRQGDRLRQSGEGVRSKVGWKAPRFRGSRAECFSCFGSSAVRGGVVMD